MFEYTPWTPPVGVTTPGTGGAKRKPTHHETAVRESAESGEWRQFIITPGDPEDPYGNAEAYPLGNLLEHRSDLYRATRTLDREHMSVGSPGWRIVVQSWKSAEGSAPDAFDEKIISTKDTPLTTADYPVAIRFQVLRKKTR